MAAETAKGSNVTNLSDPAGYVTQISGRVVAKGSDGIERVLNLGEPVYANELIRTIGVGTVAVEFVDGTRMDLGRETQTVIDDEVFNPEFDGDTEQIVVEVEAIQAMILAGLDPTEVAEDTAAGVSEELNDNGFGVDDDLMLDLNWQHTTPESGFETSALFSSRLPANNDELMGLVESNAELSVSLSPQTTVDSTPALSGTVNDPNASISVIVNGTQFEAINNGDGTWVLPDDSLSKLEVGNTSVEVTASDSEGNTDTYTGIVTVVNDPPVASRHSDNAQEDGATITGTVPVATDAFGDLNPAGYALLSGVSEGSLTFDADGSYTFDVGTDFQDLGVGNSRDVTFSYTASDLNGGVSAPATVTITVIGTNDAPVVSTIIAVNATDDAAEFNVDLLVGSSDVDASDSLSVVGLAVTGGDTSGVNINGNSLSVDPNAYDSLAVGESEVITYNYQVIDGNGGTVTQTATITITGTNNAPTVSSAVSVSSNEDDAVFNVDLLAGAADAETSDSLSISGLTLAGGDNGGITVSGTSLSVDPNAYNSLAVGESEVVTYSYNVSDGNCGTVAQTATVTITGTNDAPTVSSAVSVSATEDDAGFSVDLLAGAGDVDASDSLSVSGLTVTAGNDSGVTVSGNSLSIDPTVYNSLAVGESEFITYSYTITDGNGGTVAQTATITITGTNDAPTVSSAVSASTTEDDAGFSVDLLAGVSDVDASDSLGVSGLMVTGGDDSGVTVSGNSLNVDPNVYNSLAMGESEVITYSYNVTDGNGGTIAQTATVIITGTNHAPTVSSAVSASATEDDAGFSVDLLAGASDVDTSDGLNVSDVAVTGGDASGVIVSGNILSVYPNAYNSLAVGESEVITYSYNVTDGNGGTVAQTATITITGSNDAPTVSSAVSASATEDDAGFSVDLLAGVGDVDASDSLSVSGLTVTSGDASGITVSGNSLSVDPTAYNSLAVGESEVITYTYNVTDGNGGTVAQTATVKITGTNDAPTVSSAISASAAEDAASFGVDLLAGASDGDTSDSLAVSGLTVTGGDDTGVTVSGNSLSVDPTAYNSLAVGESEVITYSYNVTDGNGGTVAQTATITITGSNDAPTVSLAVSASATEDDAGFSVDLLAGAGDVDASDSLSVSGLTVSSGDDSGVTVIGNSLSVDPTVYNSLAVGESEVITYSYNVTDGNGGTVAQTATVTITGSNDAPTVSSAVSASATEDDAGFSVDLLAGASDIDTSDSLSVSGLTVTAGDDSGVTVSGDSLSVDPNAYNSLAVGESEIITYSYNVTDGNGGTVAQTATITITGSNDAPTVSSAVSASATEDDASFSVDLLAGASDGDSSDSLSVSGLTVSSGDDSWVTVSGNSLSVDPSAYNSLAAGESEVITYSYNVSDGNGGTVAQTATITITGTNDAPTVSSAVSASATEDDAGFSVDLLAGASDIDTSDSLSVSGLTVTAGDDSGVIVSGDSLSVDPSAYNSLAVGESEIITYTYNVTDGNGGTVAQTATITITGSNDAPTVSSAVSASVTEDDASFSVDLLAGATDVDTSDGLAVSGLTVTAGDDSGVTVSGNSLSVDPTAYNSLAVGESEVITYSYNVSDGNGGTVAQTATITITGTNDAPTVSSAVSASATEDDAGFSVDLLAGAGDVDASDSLSVSGLTVSSGDDSGVTVSGNSLNVDPSAYNSLAVDESEVITYTYNVTDGNGGTVAQTATITITGTNDAPTVSSAVSASATEDDASFSVDLLAGASDVDTSDSLSVSGLTVTGGDDSGVTVSGDSLSIDTTAYNSLAVGESEVITYSYNVSDGNGGTVAQTATITITGTNDAPTVSSAVSASATEDDAGFSVDLLAGAGAVDASDSLSVSGLTVSSGDDSGVTVSGNSLNVDPSAYNSLAVDESEVITYSYNVSDGNGGTVAQTATITVTGSNDGPVVANSVHTVAEDSLDFALNLPLPTDVDTSDVLTVMVTSLPSAALGTVTLADGTSLGLGQTLNLTEFQGLEFDAVLNATGSGNFTYEVSDGAVTVSGTATIEVGGSNDVPVAVDNSYSTSESSTYSGNLLTNDTGAGVDNDPDGDSLTVSAVNGQPSAVGTAIVLSSGATLTVQLDGSFVYDPSLSTSLNALAEAETGTDIFTYTIDDGNGATDTATVTLTITGTNDVPMVSSTVSASATEDDASFSVDLLAGASDVDTSDSLSVSGLSVSSGDDSGITVSSNSLSVDPSAYNSLAAGESEVITYSYNVSDGNGGTVAQTATVTITGSNDAPTVSSAVSASVTEDEAGFSVDLLAGTSDVDVYDSLSVSGLTVSSGDDSGITVSSNSLSVDPSAYNSLAVGESEVITYSYTITDGNGGTVAQTATITITGTNDAPTVSSAVSASATEDDAAFSVDLLATAGDVDASDSLSVSGLTVTAGDDSGVTVSGDSLSVDPNAYNSLAVGESEIITYSYNVTDGNGGTVAQTATITITGTNDAPTVSSVVTASATEDDAGFSVDLLAGATDVDTSDGLAVSGLTVTSGNDSGVTVSGNSLSVDPTAYNSLAVGESEIITYSYNVTDGNSGTVAQTATITITGTNDAPTVSSAVSASATEDDAGFSVDLLAGAGDVDASDSLGVSGLTVTAGDDSGIMVSGNSLSVDPSSYNSLAVGESEVITYSYNVTDGNGGTVAQTATITITGSNDAPTVSSAVSASATEDDAGFSVDLLAGAGDVDASDSLSVSGLTVTSGDTSGITVAGNSLSVDPNAYNSLAVGESEVVTYSYNVTDGNGGTVAQTATVTITGSNDAPTVSSAVSASATEDDASFSVDLLAGALDVDTSDSLSVSGLTVMAGDDSGFTVSGNSLSVDATAYNSLAVGESEVITYSYNVSDGNGGTVAQTATITITGTNDAPTVSSAVSASATEDDAGFSVDLLASASDADASDGLSVAGLTVTGGDASGVTVSGNSLSVDPSAYNSLAVGESEVITYSYTIIDGNGGAVAQTATVTITGTNDAPTVSSAVSASAAEDDAGFSVDLLAGASDGDTSDSLSVSGLTVTAGDDSGITVSGNSLSVDPTAYNSLAVGESEVITYSYTITDGNGGTVAQTATVTITGTNDAPTVSSAVSASSTEDDAGFSVDLLAGASDVDASDGLTVSGLTVTSGDTSGVTVSGNSLSVDPSVYNSLAVGESEVITYSYTITDGNGGGVAQTATVTITGTNDAPMVSSAVTATATEDDASFSVDLLASSSDVDDSDSLTVSGLTVTGGDASGVTVSGNSLSVDPNAYNSLAVGESEVITYSYTITDGNGGTVAQTATVTITGTNDAPTVSSAVSASATEDDASFSVDLLAGASDVDASDGQTVSSLTVTGGDANGVTVSTNSLSVDPNAYNSLAVGESEVITYSYTITDGNGGAVDQAATVTITGTNDAPTVSSAVSASSTEDDAGFSVDLLAGASDVDASDGLTVSGLTVTGGDASGVTVSGNSLSVDPNAYSSLAVGESEVITYSYTITDGNGGTVAQTATVTITGTNDAPTVSSAVTASSTEDDASFSVDLLAGASDVDTSDSLSVTGLTVTGGDASGVTVSTNSVSVDPNAYNSLAVGESEVITYSYTITDGNGGAVAQTATVTITGTNDTPTVSSAVTDTATEDDASFSVDLLASSSDVDASDSLTVSGLTVTGGDASGVTVSGTSLSVDPSAYNSLAVGESEVITYSYTITDGNGGAVAQTATVTITGTNDAPTVSSAVSASSTQDDAGFSVDLLAGASDVDASDSLSVTGLAVTGGDASGVTVSTNSVSVDPNAYNSLAVGESEVITYSYTITDGNGGAVAQTATVTITGTNDAPTVSSTVTASATEDDASFSVDLLAGASDVDASDGLTVSGLTVTGGDVSGVTVSGNSLSVDPNAYSSLAVGESEVITYSYTITDGNGGSVPQTATITITGTNDAPTVSSAVTATATEDDASFSVDLLASSSDVDDSDSLSVSGLTATSGDASGVTVSGNSLSVDPSVYNSLAVGESEVITYSYTIIDGNGGAVAQTATVTITGTNDAPTVSSAVSASSTEDDAGFSVDLLAGASDGDTSDSLSVSGLTVTAGDDSGITVSGNSLSVDPTAYNSLAVGESEVITYSYNVSDGNGGTVAQTATITITGTNDALTVSSAVSASATEDDAGFSVDLLAGASDVDASDSLSVTGLTATGGDASGVTISGNSLSVDPNAYNGLAVGESEIITYSYTITDGNGGAVAQTLTITITGTNDAPAVSSAVSASSTEDDAGFSVDLLAGASDGDTSDSLSVSGLTVTSGDASGITVAGTSLSVDPNAYNSLAVGESEVVTYSYNVTDGNGGTVAQTATVTITGSNDAPTVSSAVSASATEDDASFSVDLLAGALDVDTSDSLSVSGLTVTAGDDSGITVSGNSLSVDPTAYNSLAVGESEVITYSYNVSDGNGGTVAQTATITITGTNDAPTVSSAVSASATEDDAGFSVDLLAGAGDVDASDSLSVSGLTVTAGNDSGVTVSGNSLSVDPNAYNSLAVGESEVITYSYNVTDGNGGTVAQTATITITGSNDAPTVSSAVSASATEDDAAFSVDLLAGASDADASDGLAVSGLTVSSGDDSGVTVSSNSLSVDPNAYNSLAVGESEVITYTYNVIDGNGGSVAQTATITITGTNDAPTVSSAISASATEDDASFSVDLLAGASDIDISDSLGVSGLTVTGGDASGVTVGGNSLSVDPTAYNSLAVGESEVITYSYTITDGNGGSVPQTATISITGTNDAPTVAGAITTSAVEDTAVFNVNLLENASDVDGSDTLNVSGLTLTSGDAIGVTVSGNSLSVNPAVYDSLGVGETEFISYSYNVTDSSGGSVPQTATITIVGTNDGPVIDLDQNDSTVPGFGFVANYSEGASPVFIADSDINISDVDDNNIESATITISNVEAGDLLTVGALPAGIAASAYDPATGVMTLSGVASLSDYQTAIRAVQYSNDGSASGAARNIEVAIDDGNDTATASTTIGMTLVPTVAITDVSVQEPQSGTATLIFTISVDQTLASDLTFDYQTSDISALAGLDYLSDSGIATITAGTSSTTITVTVNSDADVFEGDETFTLNLTNFNQTVNHDAAAHLVTGGVQGIGTIGADNGAPIANDDNFITAPDTPIITGNVLTNDALVDNAVVNSYQSTSTGGGAVVYNNDGTFSYAPAAGFTGTDTFTYQLIDADGQIDTATVTIDVTDAVVNPPLVSSVPDSSYVENGSPVNLMSGISLADVDSTTFSSVVVRIEGYVGSQDIISYLTAGTSVNASVSVTGNIWELTLSDAADINEYRTVLNTLTYENSSENPSTAARAVTLEAYDSAYSNIYGSDTGTLMITPVNDAPIVMDNDVYTLQSTNDNALNISAPTDYDNDDTLLTITVTGVPTSNGTVMMADGVTPLSVGQTLTLTELTSLVFDSNSIEGAEAFTYTVSDGSSTVVGTTTIDVGTTNVDVNTVYESGLPSGTESDSGLSMATGNLLANDAMSPGSIDSIDFGVGTYTPVSGVITVTTPLGTLTVYADNSMPGHSVGDYEYVLNSQDGSGNDVIETFTYNFTSGLAYSDTLSITIIDDQPVANDTIEDIPESEEQVFNVILTLDISTSMNAQVGTTGQTRLELAREALTALGREYFNQSSQVNVTVLLFADGAHTLGAYSDFTDLEAAIAGIRDAGTSPAYTNNSPNDPDTYLSNSTSYNDALSLIEEEFTADIASQNPADNVQNISYFLSDGAITSNGSPIGNGFDTFVNSNSINSYSAGIGTGLPSNLSDLNFVHNIDSLGQGNGAVDDALIISDVALLEAELLSTVPTAFGGNITLDGTVANVLFGADGGFVESITLDIGTFTYDGSIVTVPAALAATVEVDGSRLTLGADDGFTYGTFTFDFSDGNYLFTAPNGTAPNTFAINYTIRDADGDTASAVATVNIVDDRPEARDDLDTIQHFEVADGNVISGLGTDAGPKLGAGFTPFAAQGGGVDKVVDNADVTSFDYKGNTFDLDFVALPANGSSGDLQWTFTSETDIDGVLVTQVTVTDNGDNSVLVFRSNGYYSYTPQEAADAPTPQTIITTSAPSYAADGLILNSPHGNIRYGSRGAGIEGGGSNSRVNYQETLVMTFDTVTMPLGVTDVSLGLTSWDSGETVLIDIFDTMGAAIAGNLLFDAPTIDLSGYSGIGRIEMTGASPTDPTNVRLYSVDYTEIIAATDTMLEPVTIDYVLTDSDGQSDSAQLTIYVTDNTINGTDGADNISGHAENDAIYGDAGDDILSGNDGHDTIAGGAGADSLFGGTGQDTLSGGDDNDVLYGNDGNDHLAGDAGDDIVDGGTGDDIVQGGDGDDLVFGGGGDDHLEGGAGNDALYGGAGYDIIVGDEGDDVIFGGAGNDLLSGGKDRDTFIWQVGDEGESAEPGVDIITDFDDTEGRDVLDLSDLLQDEENNSLTDYLQFQLTDTDGDGDSETQINIDVDGGSSFETTQQIILEGVDLTVGGTLSDQEIINTLLIKATIVTD